MSKTRTRSPPKAAQHDQPRNGVALLIIDMINGFDFEGAEALLPKARKAVQVILSLRQQADDASIPTIYVNDNFGEWHSEKSALIEKVGDRIIHPDILPREQDYFVIKPQLSAFYATNLPVLLPKLGVSRLLLTGIVADACVLLTAFDAHMRDYGLWIPEDAVAAETAQLHRTALAIARKNLDAETRATSTMRLATWGRKQPVSRGKSVS